jgi:uncharacterized membrane protein YedE/YeeE
MPMERVVFPKLEGLDKLLLGGPAQLFHSGLRGGPIAPIARRLIVGRFGFVAVIAVMVFPLGFALFLVAGRFQVEGAEGDELKHQPDLNEKQLGHGERG